ncbi:MAG: hypothetical protein SFV15_04130 [Polyangiaceae bacterium]|nr:hypothetical protein [Polyangiaceae bacterium]
MAQAPPMDEEGTLRGQLSLGDVLCPLMIGGRSCMVRVEEGTGFGLIWLREGLLVEARLGDMVGERALFTLLALSSGRYWVQVGEVDVPARFLDGGLGALERILIDVPEWVRLCRVLPPGRSTLAVSRSALERTGGRLTPQELPLLKAIHEGYRIEQLSLRSGLPEMVVLRRLLNLFRLEVISVIDEMVSARHTPQTPPGAALERPISSYPPPVAVEKPSVGYALKTEDVTEAVTIAGPSRPAKPISSRPPKSISSRPPKSIISNPPGLQSPLPPATATPPPGTARSETPPALFAVHAPHIERAPKVPADLLPTGAYSAWSDSPLPPPRVAPTEAHLQTPENLEPENLHTPGLTPPIVRPEIAPSVSVKAGPAPSLPFAEHQMGASKVFASLPHAARLNPTRTISSVPVVVANKWVYRGTGIGSFVVAVVVGAGLWFAGQRPLVALALIPLIIGGSLQVQLIFKMWLAIQDGRAEVSPRRAVALLFVPIFGLYWFLRVVPGYASAFNTFVERHQISTPRLSKHLILAAIFVPLAGLVAYWMVIGQICDGIAAIAAHINKRRSEPPAAQKR